MDDLIKWEPQDNQHLTAKIVPITITGINPTMTNHCSLCGRIVNDDDRYCRRCGARFEWKEGE